MRGRRRRADDRGSAPAEFALVGGLLVVVFLAVVQLAIGIHVRNTLVAAASEGAEAAARAGSPLSAGVERTRSLVRDALSPSYAEDVTVRRVTVAGATTVEVRVRAPLPVVGLAGPSGTVVVTAHALVEQP